MIVEQALFGPAAGWSRSPQAPESSNTAQGFIWRLLPTRRAVEPFNRNGHFAATVTLHPGMSST
jgi:hypothetical protein